MKQGLNLKKLACMEDLNRRRILFEEARKDNPEHPNFEAAHLYLGEEEDAPGVAMNRELRAHVAGELGKEAAITKERTKAREAKEQEKASAKAKAKAKAEAGGGF